MTKLVVSLNKLRKYVEKNYAYRLTESNNSVILTFSPRSAEIEAHLGGSATMELSGQLRKGRVRFTKALLVDTRGRRDLNMEETEASFSAWLEDIEARY